MSAQLLNYLIYAALMSFMAFIYFRRIRRSFGQQTVRRGRLVAGIAIFSVIGCMLMLGVLRDIHLAEGLLGGAAIGAALGFAGLRLTRFETDSVKGDCYVPNPWIGATLAVLLLGRLVWRFMLMQHMQMVVVHVAPGAAMPTTGYHSSPLTMLMIGLLAGYYIVYFAGLLVHHRRFQRALAR